MVLAIPSAPLSPLGLLVWISQPEGQRSTLPMNAYLMSAPFKVARVWNPQYWVQNPELSFTSEEVSTKYTPLASVGKLPLVRCEPTTVCSVASLRVAPWE